MQGRRSEAGGKSEQGRKSEEGGKSEERLAAMADRAAAARGSWEAVKAKWNVPQKVANL